MLYLSDLAMMCNVGDSNDAIAKALLTPNQPLPERQALFGEFAGLRVGNIRAALPPLPEALMRYDCANNRIAAALLRQMNDALARLKARLSPERIAVVVGTSTAGIDNTGAATTQYLQSGHYPAGFDAVQGALGSLGEFVALCAGVKGPAFTVSTACSSSGNALLSARRLLRLGLCDAVIVGGVDTLCELTLQGFSALEATSAGLSEPWSAHRDGINIGEAGALMILSADDSEGSVCFLGGASSSDAHHISAPHPEGRGAIAAMRGALEDATLTSADIDYINLHGTGTPHNDAMEAAAVNAVFGERTPCASTKSLTGHTLGASSALELGMCYLALQHEGLRLPPMPPVTVLDERLAKVNLHTTLEHLPASPSYVLSNSFAFGGSNVSLIIGRKP